MIKILLALPEVIESEFVHLCGVDRPRVAQIPLLNAGLKYRAESRNVRAGTLEIGKRFGPRIVVEIVVGAKLLAGVDSVIEVNRKLIAELRFHGIGTEYTGSIGRLDWRAMREKTKELLASLEIRDLQADRVVGSLSVGGGAIQIASSARSLSQSTSRT